jgi:HK97 family phage portal protein
MGLLGKLFSFQRTTSIDLNALADSGFSARDAVTAETALGVPPLWRAVNIICEDVSGTPFRVYRTEGEDSRVRAVDHSSYSIVHRKAGKTHTSRQLRELLTLHALMHGDGYARIWRNNRGQVVDLEPLPPFPHTYPVIAGTGSARERYYVTSHYGESRYLQRLDAADVLHIPGLSYDGIKGLSVVDILEGAISGSVAVQEYATLYFEQGGNVKGFLRVPQKLQPEQQEDVRKNWQRMANNKSNQHGVAVLTGGIEYQQLSSDAESSQLIDARRYSITDVSNITGVRPHDLGDQSGAAYNSLEWENRSHVDRAIGPWLTRWEDECDDKLLTEAEKRADTHRCRFDRDYLIKVGLAEQAEADHKYRECGVLSANEVRRNRNLPSVPDGDKRHVPMNWQESDQTTEGLDENDQGE